MLLATQPPHEAKVGDAVEMRIDLVDKARLVAAFGQEHAQQFDDVVGIAIGVVQQRAQTAENTEGGRQLAAE